ncbi:MAG TPA: ABC transporter permease subunit [Ktedonosporobacter sp.]|jgi:ABC-type transport system involved in multi-copper enzyme maturation permease subunit|nr:ABC transporter permease subunit [Ktedonosporobacter sp.]
MQTTHIFHEEHIPTMPRISSVVVGRQGYLSVLARLIIMELQKIRRRLMSKVLAVVGIGMIMSIFILAGIFAWSIINSPASKFAPPLCSQTGRTDGGCLNHQPTPNELAQYKQAQVNRFSRLLSLPSSLNLSITYTAIPLTMLIIILIGSIVGGEYSYGTIRLLYTRGPTRLQFLLAKIGAAIICIVPMVLAMALAGVLTGYLFHPITGVALNFSFLTGTWLANAGLFLLLAMWQWFVFAMMALFFGTVGRSTVAGVVGALSWFFLELILTTIISAIANLMGGSIGDFLRTIPDYFVGNNTMALLQNQAHVLFNADPATISNAHAWSVIAVYLVVMLVVSCLVTVLRDVTN